MNKGRKVAIVATALALALAGAAGAAHTGMLSIRVGGGSPEAGGIKVHGKWSLVVRNKAGKAGKVVARRHFENALTASGAQMLAELLGGTSSVGRYGVVGGIAVQLDDGSTAGHGCNLLIAVNPCWIAHTNPSSSDDSVGSGPLHLLWTSSSLTLSGQVTPPATTTFTKAETMLKLCSANTSAWDCASGDSTGQYWASFTSKSLTQPLTVQAGQSVAVSVKISFS